MFYKFSFGRKAKSITKWAVISLILSSIVIGVHKCTGISEDKIWDLIDSIQRTSIKKGIPIPSDVNEYIINTPELLNRRINRDIDQSINEYHRNINNQYIPRMKNKEILKEIEKSKYTEEERIIIKDAVYYEFESDGSEAQKLLGPTMGIRAHWVPPDYREVK